MPTILLTEVSTDGQPQPWSVNPDHVASLRPRKTLRPIDAQQDPRTTLDYNGTIVEMATGQQHFVTEDFFSVHELMAAQPTPQIEAEKIKTGTVPKEQPKKAAQKPSADPEPEGLVLPMMTE